MPPSHDAIVIGGGLVGAAIAWGLTGQGLRPVLLDEGDVAYRASRGNFGLVWVQSKGFGAPHYQRWTRASAAEWPALAADLAARTGRDVGLRQPGGVQLCLSEAEFEERAARMAQMRAEAGNFGFDHRMIPMGPELREMLPGLGPRVVGASFTPYDGHANPLVLLHALHRAFTEAGGTYVPNARVEDDIHAAPHDFAVTAGGQRFAAPRVVLAAGLGNADLAPRFGLHAPVRPQRGQVIVTERAAEVLPMPVTTIRQTTEGSIMLGDSVEEVGFDTRQRPEVIKVIAERAVACFPWIGRLNIVRAWSALRVMAPDGLPIYDQSESCPGAFTANCHSGVTLAGAHARLLAPMIAAGALDADRLGLLSAHRFAHGEAA
ncbi:MAG: FAD-binding oxidoreductase [Acetobacteraceae bacterium]|nr:FAD-binding oxidoreductase [Acetobacteraceae bacterium]